MSKKLYQNIEVVYLYNKIMTEIYKEISKSTTYRRIRQIRQKTQNSISQNTAAYVLASKLGIDVYRILKNERDELSKFQQALDRVSSMDQKTIKEPRALKSPKSDNRRKITQKRMPYDYPLSNFELDDDLIKNCKIRPPYRTAVREAALALEVRIRNKLKLDSRYFGKKLIQRAKDMGTFDRPLSSESEGLYFTYAGAVQWLRNPPEHQQIEYTKEEAIKIVLYFDYLIKLFDNLVTKNI